MIGKTLDRVCAMKTMATNKERKLIEGLEKIEPDELVYICPYGLRKGKQEVYCFIEHRKMQGDYIPIGKQKRRATSDRKQLSAFVCDSLTPL